MKEYTNHEYADLVSRAQDALKEAEGWGDGYASSQGQTLIELMADMTDSLHYMLARRSAENYMQTARLRSTVISRASDMGYRFKRVSGNSGYLRISLTNSSGNPVVATAPLTIPKFTPFTYGERHFVTSEECIIEMGDNAVEVLVKEGVKQTQTLTVPTNGIVFITDYSDIDQRGLYIDTPQGEYLDIVNHPQNKRALTFLRFNDRYFDIKYQTDGMEVIFGNNRFGARPSGNINLITIRTSVTSPILTENQSFELDEELLPEPLLDDMGNVYTFSVTNSTPITGAEEEESIESIKRNSPLYSRSNGKAVINEDYEYWILNSGLGGIKDAKAFGEQELRTFVYNMNNVFITYLTENGGRLTSQEHQAVLDYFKTLKVAAPHIVLRPANIMGLRYVLDAKKSPSLEVSDAEFYAILNRFMDGYFSLKAGSIGMTVHSSDVVSDLYKQRHNVGGVEREVVDFVKLQLFAHYDFDYPPRASKAFVTLDTDYDPTTGDTFILILENMVCEVPVYSSDTKTDILLRMRDRIMDVTPFVARVDLTGAALDGFGNPVPIEVNPAIGDSILIGVDTPYFSQDQLLGNFAIGSTTASVIRISPDVQFAHHYYSSPAGRRPMIPLRPGTTVNFTAPSDTSVRIYYRNDMHNAATEELYTTLAPGQTFDETLVIYHSIQFEYVSNSAQDVTVTITYPSTAGTSFGLTIENTAGRGLFQIQKTSGDLSDSVIVDYSLQLPVQPKTVLSTSNANLIVPGSLSIRRKDTNNMVFGENGGGYFTDGVNTISTGRIDYATGEIYLPEITPTDVPLYVRYKQDGFDNFTVGSDTAIQLVSAKPSMSSSISSPSIIRVV